MAKPTNDVPQVEGLKPEQQEHFAEVHQYMFGRPNKTGGSDWQLQAYDTLARDPGYTKKRKQLESVMSDTVQDIMKTMEKYVLARNKVNQNTRESIEMLFKDYLRMVGVVGQSVKLHETPYETAGGSNEFSRSQRDTMDRNEIPMVQAFVNELREISKNPKEFVDMVFENQEFVTMLKNLHTPAQGPAGVKDTLTETPSLPNYKQLRKLILGLPTVEKGSDGGPPPKKSEHRKTAEAGLWIEIVGKFTLAQKEALVNTFFKEGSDDEAKRFINSAVLARVMSVAEVDAIANDKLNGVREGLGEIVQAREKMQTEYERIASTAGNENIRNAASHLLTFNKIAGETFARLGFLTAFVNLVLSITSTFKDEKGRLLTRIPISILKGSAAALTNGWFLFGLGEMAAGINIVSDGWLESKIYAPSQEQLASHANYQEQKFAKEQLENHKGLGDYVMNNYDNWRRIAEQNKNDTNPRQRDKQGELVEKRGSFDLWPGDVKMTDKEAGEFGYESRKDALVAIHRIFGVYGKFLKIENKEKLQEYFVKNNILLATPKTK